MSLRTKFAILVLMLALTISGSMAVALWSFGLQRSQLLGPYADTPEVLERLRRVAEHAREQAEALNAALAGDTAAARPRAAAAGEAAPPERTPLERFTERTDSIREDLRVLIAEGETEKETPGAMQAGTVASRTLAAKVESLQLNGLRALETRDESLLVNSIATATEISRLVTAQSNQVLVECLRAIETVEVVRRKLLASLGWACLAAALIGALALILVRRWVLRPVADLRTAANRIAEGDFRHRIASQGRDELGQLAGDVNRMAGMIERMLAERVERERLAAVGEMVRRLAHNLRNPLAGIRGLAELTRDELELQPELRDAQERIIGSVDRFEKWLADLLSVTRPLAIAPERARVEPLLSGLVQAHRPLARTKEIVLELHDRDAPAEAWFDPRHLEHSLVAILTNAIQASPVRSTVRISARSIPLHDEWEIRIADQGPGVPPELIEKVFNAYFTTKRDGNGIGLAVAQQVVRAHGGRITVEAGETPERGPGPGATFVVRLPLRATATAAYPSGLSAASPAAQSSAGEASPAVRPAAECSPRARE